MRADNRQCPGIEIRHVDGVADRPFEQRGTNGLRNLDANTFLRFRRGSAKMRSENEIGCQTEGRITWQWLNLEHIERGSGNMSILQGICERSFVDETAPRAVDDAHAVFCFLRTRCIK